MPDAREARVSPPPIYLHFLDRELGEAFEFVLDLRSAQRALSALTLGTASPLVCSMSALLENTGLRGGEEMVGDLVAADVLLPLSTHATMREFLDSRRAMYEHDQARYPLYFGTEPPGALAGLEPQHVPGSTTERLHERLIAWTEGESAIRSIPGIALPTEVRRRMMEVVAEELGRRENRAVTYAMFGAKVGSDPSGHLLERFVRRRISLEYTHHHRGGHGRLATGVGIALAPLEHAIELDSPFERDVPIVRALLEAAGLGALLDGWPRPLWQLFLPLRGNPEHFAVVSRIQWIARALDDVTPPSPIAIRRQRAITAVRSATNAVVLAPGADAAETLIAARSNLEGVARVLSPRGLESALTIFSNVLEPLKADVLLIVATDVEECQLLDEFGFPPGKSPARYPHGQQIYLDLGVHGGQRTFLVRSDLGSGGSGGSGFTADDAIADLGPDWVLMVGIAYGAEPATQEIGDVLIPTEVILYDHQRIGTDATGERIVEYRDAPGRPDAALLKRLRAAKLDFGDAEVRFGRLLSGSDLVDNEAHRRELVEQAARGKAIGGEMELHGVFAAAGRQRGRWIAAKAICDFADGRKAIDKLARQELAARNAARFARHVIEHGLLASPP